MTYSKNQLNSHVEASRKLDKVMAEVFEFIRKNSRCREYEVQQFILARFAKHRLKTDRDRAPIVAFGKSTAEVHHYPAKTASLRLKPESLIMVDIWARLDKKGSVFSDITWMAYFGKNMPLKIKNIFNLVVKARDVAVTYIRSCLKNGKVPLARALDLAARNIIAEASHGRRFVHTTGHSLGLNQPHGRYKGIRTDNFQVLKTELPYTIEPGVYFKNKFGIRSEIDFYLTRDLKLKISTNIQKRMVFLQKQS